LLKKESEKARMYRALDEMDEIMDIRLEWSSSTYHDIEITMSQYAKIEIPKMKAELNENQAKAERLLLETLAPKTRFFLCSFRSSVET
jgi:hypothetical protein